MPTIRQFEDLEIWKEAREISKMIYEITRGSDFKNDFRFRDQIRAASGSIMDNIAEGFERNGNLEFRQFLSIAKGSAGETRSQLYRATDFGYISEEMRADMNDRLQTLSGKLSKFINYLNKQDFRGTKFQNPKP